MRGATRSSTRTTQAPRFQSTLLMRGATCPFCDTGKPRKFQSTLLMRGATQCAGVLGLYGNISIHAPHARSDGNIIDDQDGNLMISIHAPHARSDAGPDLRPEYSGYFNPRSSCEERHPLDGIFLWRQDFNPRSSCEERPKIHDVTDAYYTDFNPRSSCEERLFTKNICYSFATFQSTLLMRGATTIRRERVIPVGISIHAPHARSDFLIRLSGLT